ncbi:MAG: hypothetical protein IIC25_08140 [Chloroflexi bacterium]|nr:hypothetical protein [Chloroflexota bacterium]
MSRSNTPSDADGIITAKFFEANLAFRANADELLRAAKGEEVVLAPAASASQVTADVAFDGANLLVGILRDLVVTFRVPNGQHLYGEPVPEGTVATSVTLDEIDGLIDTVVGLLNDEARLAAMAEAMRALDRPDAADRLAALLREAKGKKDGERG